MRPAALRAALAAGDGPTIVCAQAGNVNTGAFDPLDEVVATRHAERGAWVHVDGAFGLWAAASAVAAATSLDGRRRADSWATDAPQVAQRAPTTAAWPSSPTPSRTAAAMVVSAAYLRDRRDGERDGSRLGAGVLAPRPRLRDLRGAALARARGRRRAGRALLRVRAALRRGPRTREDGVEVLNDVVLNQVLVRFADDDATTDAVVAAVQAEGTCWMGPTDVARAGARCASRSPTGRRRSTTSIARARRSSPPRARRRARSELGHSVDRVRRCTRATC